MLLRSPIDARHNEASRTLPHLSAPHTVRQVPLREEFHGSVIVPLDALSICISEQRGRTVGVLCQFHKGGPDRVNVARVCG